MDSRTKGRLVRFSLLAALLIGVTILVLRQMRPPSSLVHPAVVGSASATSPVASRFNPPPPTSSAHAAHLPHVHGVEICGLGKVSVSSEDPAEIHKAITARVEPAAQHWEANMLSSDSYRARAVGTYLQMMRLKFKNATATSDFEQQRIQLLQMATESRDPMVFAVAARVCGSDTQDGSRGDCQRSAIQQWTRVDPDNAVPWLLLAASAHSTGAREAEQDAVQHASNAHQFNAYGDALYAFSAQAMPSDVTPFERAWLATNLMGYQAAWPSSEHLYLRAYCSAEAVATTQVRSQCESLAKLVLKQGQTLLDLMMSRILGARLGWPKGQLDGIQEETQALQMTFWQEPSDDSWSCDRVTHYNEYFGELSRMSELAAAREAAARTGVSMSDLAQRYTDRIEEMRRARRLTTDAPR